jgi:hypothetical protein
MDRIVRWLRQTEEFLDGWGKGAWIAAFVLGFIVFWPIGLAILGYTIWSGRMGCWKHRGRQPRRGFNSRSSGNSAFDEYRAETLRRLEEEQTEFESFLERLRRARDKAEFDQFMNERRRPGPDAEPQTA